MPTVAFLPWLPLPDKIQVGAVRFVPLTPDSPHPDLGILATAVPTILSSHRNLQGDPITACTVALLDGRAPGEDLLEDDLEAIQLAAGFLSLAAFARNEYGCSWKAYANSTFFQPVFQQFSKSVGPIALSSRRRDGHHLSGGYQHGQPLFSVPPQCTRASSVKVDEEFAAALGKAHAAGSHTTTRLLPALSFFNLANTDSETMLPQAEIFLLGAAFEQFTDTDSARKEKGMARKLAHSVAEALGPYGAVKVREIPGARRSIPLGLYYKTDSRAWNHDPCLEKEQKDWFLHKKWAEELHHLRSVYVHGQDPEERAWGWSPLEHLVMAAFVFPLLVKVCLQRDGHYALSEEDSSRLSVIDDLLAETNWFAGPEQGEETTWQRVFRRGQGRLFESRVRQAWKEFAGDKPDGGAE